MSRHDKVMDKLFKGKSRKTRVKFEIKSNLNIIKEQIRYLESLLEETRKYIEEYEQMSGDE